MGKFSNALKLFCFLIKCIILVFLGVLTEGIQNSYILQVRYKPINHIYLIRLVVLKRPGFQSQKYGLPAFDLHLRIFAVLSYFYYLFA